MKPLLLVGKENATTLLTKYYGEAKPEKSEHRGRARKAFEALEKVPDYSIVLIYEDEDGKMQALVKNITEKFDKLIKTSFSSNSNEFINNLLNVGKLIDPDNEDIYEAFKVEA
ncbi:hypothetical protein D3P96_02015 [Weissella viridescens]|uniref:Uncharacterized protein n=1 Tax=Weissella viridescens TaxID=1629 RepID=A0A3P2RM63_WEIVI|nr:hypothetical protein [Weissella viridescens]RRG18782.1 hypothetical protein D3P96_02015 [Weissella viridescens]